MRRKVVPERIGANKQAAEGSVGRGSAVASVEHELHLHAELSCARRARRIRRSRLRPRRGLPTLAKPRLVGFNYVALEVGDIEEALAFYGRLFTFELRGKNDSMAFIDLGDQFIAVQEGRRQPADDGRHFGLVVDDKEAARRALDAAGRRSGLD